MGHSSETEQIRRRLAGAARRKAFESYVRRGSVPDGVVRLAEIAADEGKFLDFGRDLSVTRRPEGRPTAFYVWRTAGDERVRPSHSAHAEELLPWSHLLPIGHPGNEPNCRCWPEPYYGNPAIPDALLPLNRERRVDTTGTEPWASIEILRRPDGSVAESAISTRDGAQVHSTFEGRKVLRSVSLATGQVVRFESHNKIQNIHIGKTPLLQSAWTPQGVVVARPRTAFRDVDNLMPGSNFDLVEEPFDPLLDPDLLQNLSSLDDPSKDLAALIGAALTLFLVHQYAPESMGIGATDVPVIGYKIWTNTEQLSGGPGGKPLAVPVMVDALTAEQARQTCKLLPEVQAWTDEAALALASGSGVQGSSAFGTRLHKMVKDKVNAKKEEFPFIYRGVSAEFSIDAQGGPASYGGRGTRRLDVIEKIPPEDPKVICDYEIKTGAAQLSGGQLRDQIVRLAAMHPGATIYVFLVGPTYRPPR